MKLNKVESSFRCMKSELGTRPIYHQKDARIESHLFISVLAYGILRSIEHTLKSRDYHKNWSTIRETLLTHYRTTVIQNGKYGEVYNVRVTGTPEKDQKIIFDTLDIKINPNRKISRKLSE